MTSTFRGSVFVNLRFGRQETCPAHAAEKTVYRKFPSPLEENLLLESNKRISVPLSVPVVLGKPEGNVLPGLRVGGLELGEAAGQLQDQFGTDGGVFRLVEKIGQFGRVVGQVVKLARAGFVENQFPVAAAQHPGGTGLGNGIQLVFVR